jgi:hypothetical protein
MHVGFFVPFPLLSVQGDVMENAIFDRSAERNSFRSGIANLKLILLWLAVLVPLGWGVMEALKDVRHLIP